MKSKLLSKVSPKDLLDLQTISKRTFSETYSSGNTEENMQHYLDGEFSLKKLEAELNERNSEFYFALYNASIVGYLKINFGNAQTEMTGQNTLEIQRIYVLAGFQGNGIGALLFEKAMTIAQQKEVDFVWLGVWEENPKAINFYEKLGFEAYDQHTFVVGNDVQTDIMMKKTI